MIDVFDLYESEKKDCMFRCKRDGEFTTLRGLNVHKKSCHIFNVSETLEKKYLETLYENLFKPGIKLPKNDK